MNGFWSLLKTIASMDDPELYKPETSLRNEESSVTTEDAANNNNNDGVPVQIKQNTQRSTWPRYEWFWESLCSSSRKIFNKNDIFFKMWSPKMMLVHCQTSNPVCEHVGPCSANCVKQEILGIWRLEKKIKASRFVYWYAQWSMKCQHVISLFIF